MLHSFEWHACHFLLDVWLWLPWSGCPSFNISLLEWSLLIQPLTLTCLGLPGLATQSGRFLEKASGAYTCLSADTHKHEKWGLGRPDKLPTSPALWWLSMGETRWPSRRWEDKWKVRELSGDSTQSQCFLQTWRWTFILSPFIQSFSTTCVWMYKGHSDSKQSESCRHLCVCGQCMCRAAKASVPDCRERIRRLECKTLLDLGATFETKSLAHICPSWVMIQLVTPLECWPLIHLVSACLKHLHSLMLGPISKLAQRTTAPC